MLLLAIECLLELKKFDVVVHNNIQFNLFGKDCL